jgi:hypothetical protein
MWRRLKLLGRAWFRRVQVGVVAGASGFGRRRWSARDNSSREWFLPPSLSSAIRAN